LAEVTLPSRRATRESWPLKVEGLGSQFGRLIEGLPESIFNAPDASQCTPELSADPYKVLRELRQRFGPVVKMDTQGLFGGIAIPEPYGHDRNNQVFLALSYHAVREIGSNEESFGSREAFRASREVQGPTINTREGEDHRLIRRLFDRSMFGPRQIRDYCTSLIDPTVEYLVDRIESRLKDGQTVDLRRDLALPLVYKTISTIIGVPEGLFSEFVQLGEAAFGYNRNPMAAQEAVKRMTAHFRAELERHKRDSSPRPDMMTGLLDAEHRGYRLSDDEIVMHCRFLLPGGIETTWRQTANLFMAMMLHPEQWRAVCDDPALVEPAVEEALRCYPSGTVIPRHVNVDTEVEEVVLPAGSSVNFVTASANRDPAIWSDPDRFDIFRQPVAHLTFGMGPHFCMGQGLARQTFRTALRVMSARLPSLKLACDPSEVTMSGFALHVVGELPVKLN
jgi:cytochrome P450